MAEVKVPTMGGIGKSFEDFGLGAIAGLLFTLANNVFGGLGVLAAPLLVGSMIKGDRGKIIAVMAGFMLLAAGGLAGRASGNGSNEETM